MKNGIKIALWVLLGILFIGAGWSKLIGQAAQVEHFAQWGYPLWFLYLTGVIEVGGGICLFIPAARLSGVLILSVTMVGAAFTHFRAHEMSAFPVPLVLLGALLTLAWTMRYSPKKRSSSIGPSE